ncbi:hypothetical protein P3S67_025975 [Capsicum chacoense]
MNGTGLISLLLWNREAMQLIGKSAKESKEGLISDDECSYPSELDDIIERKLMFKIMFKESNITKHDEVYKVVKFVDDDVLFKEYSHPSLIDTTSIKNNLSGCGSSLTEVSVSVDMTKNKLCKRSKSMGKLPMQEFDDECNDKQVNSKLRKVIKKEKKI